MKIRYNKLGVQYIALCVLASCTFSSCEKFLDVEHVGKPTTEEFFNNVNDVDRALDGVYNVLASDDYEYSEMLFGEATADDMAYNDKNSTSENYQIAKFTFTSENDYLKRRWKTNYKGIFRANYVINNMPKAYQKFIVEQYVPGSVESTKIKFKEIYAQAKFLRAVFYFNLVRSFGGVPIMPEEMTLEGNVSNFYQPRNSKAEVYAFIEKELREAILGLNTDYQLELEGHAEKGAAVAYLIRVLSMNAKIGQNDAAWSDIKELAAYMVDGKQITYRDLLKLDAMYPASTKTDEQLFDSLKAALFIDNTLDSNVPYDKLETNLVAISANYDLYPRYDKLWMFESEHCVESVFEINHQESANGTTGSSNLGTNIWFELCSPTKFSSTWWGSGSSKFISFAKSIDEFRKSDPRWVFSCPENFATLTFPDANGEKEYVTANTDPAGNSCLKYYTRKAEYPRQRTDDNAKNVRVIRFAEVILWYAESLNETGDQVKAVAQIKKLRVRANKMVGPGNTYVEELENSSLVTSENVPLGNYISTRALIWQERRFELAGEWLRWWDLVRTETIVENFDTYNKQQPDNKKYFKPGINEVFPIPAEEIRLSGGVLTQNPGY